MNFNLQGAGDLAPLFLVVGIVVAALTVVIHVAFALAVLDYAGRQRTVLVGPAIWALATLLGEVFVATVYWAIHHSTLRVQAAAEGDG